MFAERKLHRGDGICECLVADDVVRVSGFLDPEGVDFPEARADFEGLRQRPLLVRIDHDAGIWACDFADDAGAAEVTLGVLGTDFKFHGGEAGVHGTLAVFADLCVAIVEPADGGVVAGIAGR